MPKIFIIIPIGVTTKKKTTLITIGAIIAPNLTPNLNHNLFNGVKNFDLVIAKNKNTRETKINKILISPPLFTGQSPKIKKTRKQTNELIEHLIPCLLMQVQLLKHI